MWFSWFLVVRFMTFWVILGAQGLILEAWGPILQISRIFVILTTPRTRKRTSFLRSKCDQEPTFCSVVFQCFFECPLFLIFCDLGCPEAPFWLHFDSFLGALGLWKNSWKCVTIVKFRGLAPSRRSLFAGLDQEGVLMTSFSRFLRFCVFLRLPFGHLLAPVVVKKQVRKSDAKKCPKMGMRVMRVKRRIYVPGAVGPLKRQKTRPQTTRQCLEHALACASARWRIIICNQYRIIYNYIWLYILIYNHI